MQYGKDLQHIKFTHSRPLLENTSLAAPLYSSAASDMQKRFAVCLPTVLRACWTYPCNASTTWSLVIPEVNAIPVGANCMFGFAQPNNVSGHPNRLYLNPPSIWHTDPLENRCSNAGVVATSVTQAGRWIQLLCIHFSWTLHTFSQQCLLLQSRERSKLCEET